MRLLFITVLILILPSLALSEPPVHTLKNQVLKVTDSGFSPRTVEIPQKGSLVFFYNETKSSLVTVEVDYGERKTFCSTGKMKLGDDGILRSKEPFSPRGFATICFAEAGEYQVKAFGIGDSVKPFNGKVIVR